MTDSLLRTLESALQDIAKENGYESPNVEVETNDSGGAGYTSHLYRGKISSPNKEDIRFFAKVASLDAEARSKLPAPIFFTELYTYRRLAEMFRKIEDKHNVAPQHRFVFPKVYGHRDTELEEVIVMQDLSAEGFTMHDRFTSFNWEYAAAAVQQIARFHALSIAMQKDFPEDFEEVKATYKWKDPDFWRRVMQDAIRDTVLKSIDLTEETHRERLRTYLKDNLSKVIDSFSEIPPRPVLNHGDMKMSNILHREREDGTIEMLLIDYQIVHVASAVQDLMHFIFTGSDAAFRAQHYHQLLDHYYQQMCLALRRLHLDPEEVFPREDFDADLKENSHMGLLFALYNLPWVLVAEDTAPAPSATLALDTFMGVDASQLIRDRLNECTTIAKATGCKDQTVSHLELLFALYNLPWVLVAEDTAPAPSATLALDTFMGVDASQLIRDRLNEVVQDYLRWGVI